MKNHNVKFKIIFFSILFSGLFGWTGNSLAADYYVSPTGSAAWANCGAPAKDGTSACSSATALANAVAGDIVHFRGGTYDQSSGTCPNDTTPMWNPAHSGTNGNPITFQCYLGETCTVIPKQLCTAIGAGGRNYITWDGFSGTAISGTGGEVTQFAMYFTSMGSIFRNLDLTGVEHNDYGNTSLIRLEGCIDCEVYNNRLHDMTGTGVNTTAIWIFGFHGPISTDPCPGVVCGARNKIYNNNFYNNNYGVMQKGNPNMGNRIYLNWFRNHTGAAVYLNDQDISGIANKGYVYQNVMASTGGIGVKGTTAINNYEVYNNTIYNTNVHNGDGVSLSPVNRGTMVWNNIIHSAERYFAMYYTGAAMPAYSNYNDFYDTSSPRWNFNYATDYTTLATWRTALGGCPKDGNDCNSDTTDPNFVNAGGSAPEDYKRISYPANGRGGAYASVMGAYITGDEIIGYTVPGSSDTVPPTAPQGLSAQ